MNRGTSYTSGFAWESYERPLSHSRKDSGTIGTPCSKTARFAPVHRQCEHSPDPVPSITSTISASWMRDGTGPRPEGKHRDPRSRPSHICARDPALRDSSARHQVPPHRRGRPALPSCARSRPGAAEARAGGRRGWASAASRTREQMPTRGHFHGVRCLP